MLQAGVAVEQRHATVESLIQLDGGSREAEAPVLRRDLQAAALPLHDVVIADHALMAEGADAREILGSGTRAKRRL